MYPYNRKESKNSRKGSGGIAIAISNSVLDSHVILGIYKGLDGQLAIKLENQNSNFKVGILGCYLPPDSYLYGQDPENFFNHASVLWENMSDCDLLIGAGDLNARTKNCMDFLPEVDGTLPVRNNLDNKKNSHGDCFLTFLRDNRALILNGRVTPQYNNFTFISTRGSSVPDYIFCPVDNLHCCVSMRTLLIQDVINTLSVPPPPSIPDHAILSGTFTSSFFKLGQLMNSSVDPIPREETHPVKVDNKRKNLKMINDDFFMSDEVKKKVQDTILKIENTLHGQTEIDEMWISVKNIFLQEMDHLPTLPQGASKSLKRSFRKSQPFWNDELARLWFSVCQSEKVYLSFKVCYKSQMKIKEDLRLKFKSDQKLFDKRFRAHKRQHQSKSLQELSDLAKDHSPEIWKKLKRLNSPLQKPPLEVLLEDGSTSRDKQAIVEKWYRDISKLFSGIRDNPETVFDEKFYTEIIKAKENFENLSEEEQGHFCYTELDRSNLNKEFSYEEVSNAINKTKTGKSYLDIPNEVMKNENAKTLLHRFLDLCFKTGLSPIEWNLSNLKPIPKTDKDRRDPLQNRCISIMCCVAKVYSSILTKRLQDYLEQYELLVEEQNGFRSKRSCIDHLFTLVTVLRNRKEQGKDTFLAFVDYKKAFDSVDRSILFFKLAKFGISGRMYKAISSLYSNPQARVVLDDFATEYFDCPIGVEQGDCLSPTLFSIFINDLALELKNVNIGINLDIENQFQFGSLLNVLLYADDIVCIAESETDLQELVFIVELWCKKFRLEVNLTKTNILHVRKHRKPQSNFTFLFDKRPIPYCTSYKYLGSYINEHLDFTFTVDKHSESAGRALSTVITKMIKNSGFPFNMFSILYSACVTSISDYSGAITGFKSYQSSFKLHLRALRAFLGVPKNVCIPGIISEFDLLLPQYRTKLQMIRHYHRILSMNDNRLTKKVMEWDKTLHNLGRVKTWSSEIEEIFSDCNLQDVYQSNVRFNKREIVDKMELVFLQQQRQQINQECEDKPKLRTFMLFKEFNEPAAYIKRPLSFYQRRMLAKLRLGCLPLRIETGRYATPRLPEENRTCLVCKPVELLVNTDNSNEQPVESEVHFLFFCGAYSNERKTWMEKMTIPENFQDLPVQNKLKIVLNASENVKATSQFIVTAIDARSKAISSA